MDFIDPVHPHVTISSDIFVVALAGSVAYTSSACTAIVLVGEANMICRGRSWIRAWVRGGIGRRMWCRVRGRVRSRVGSGVRSRIRCRVWRRIRRRVRSWVCGRGSGRIRRWILGHLARVTIERRAATCDTVVPFFTSAFVGMSSVW